MDVSRRTASVARAVGLAAASTSPQGSSRSPGYSGAGRTSSRSLLTLALAAALVLSLLSFYASGPLLRGASGKVLSERTLVRCVPDERDPMLFHLKTALAVGYSGGHWFHVAETFMTQHALLPPDRKAFSSNVYFDLDRRGFIGEMNGVTKLLVLLGLYNPQGKYVPQFAQFFHTNPAYVRWDELKVGDGLMIPDSQVVETEVSLLHDRTLRPLTTSQRIGISENHPVESRFSAAEKEDTSLEGICFKFLGTAGGKWPTPQRGHWFPKPADVLDFRRNIETLCHSDHPELLANDSGSLKHKYRLVLYQRDRSRKLVEEAQALEMLRARLPEAGSWEVEVIVHSPDRSPCSLARKLRRTDVLLTSHGFQSMLLLFLPRPSILFEVFPYRYFKRGYGPLSREYGVIHGGVMSPPVRGGIVRAVLSMVTTRICFMYKDCRGVARGDDVRLTQRGVDRLVALVKQNFHQLGDNTETRDMLDLR